MMIELGAKDLETICEALLTEYLVLEDNSAKYGEWAKGEMKSLSTLHGILSSAFKEASGHCINHRVRPLSYKHIRSRSA